MAPKKIPTFVNTICQGVVRSGGDKKILASEDETIVHLKLKNIGKIKLNSKQGKTTVTSENSKAMQLSPQFTSQNWHKYVLHA